jgi:hypothetical protein
METEKIEGTKEIEKIKKVTIDVDEYKAAAKALKVVTDKERKKALALKKQGKALKALTESSTVVEYDEKKEAAEKAKKDYDEKWMAFKKIRDKRNNLLKAIKDVKNIITGKIDFFDSEKERKAEEERLAKEGEERKKEEEKKKVIDVDIIDEPDGKCEVCGGIGEVMESADELAESIPCIACNAQSATHEISDTNKHLGNSTDKTESLATESPQKSKEGQNGMVTEQIKIEIFDIKQFYGALMRAERGIQENDLKITVKGLGEIAKKHKCKPGEIVVAGAIVV